MRIDPSYLEAMDGLGFALEALGDDPGALAAYRKATALNDERKGTFASPLVNMSAYYNRTDDPAKALDYADQALALDPHSDRAWFQKGRASERLGKLDDAVTRSTGRSRPTRVRRPTTTFSRVSTGGWAGPPTARRRWRPSNVSSARPASSRRNGAARKTSDR